MYYRSESVRRRRRWQPPIWLLVVGILLALIALAFVLVTLIGAIVGPGPY